MRCYLNHGMSIFLLFFLLLDISDFVQSSGFQLGVKWSCEQMAEFKYPDLLSDWVLRFDIFDSLAVMNSEMRLSFEVLSHLSSLAQSKFAMVIF